MPMHYQNVFRDSASADPTNVNVYIRSQYYYEIGKLLSEIEKSLKPEYVHHIVL